MIGDGGQITIIPNIPSDSELELKEGEIMDSVTVPPEDIEEGKREFKEEYYNSFTMESLKEAGAEIGGE